MNLALKETHLTTKEELADWLLRDPLHIKEDFKTLYDELVPKTLGFQSWWKKNTLAELVERSKQKHLTHFTLDKKHEEKISDMMENYNTRVNKVARYLIRYAHQLIFKSDETSRYDTLFYFNNIMEFQGEKMTASDTPAAKMTKIMEEIFQKTKKAFHYVDEIKTCPKVDQDDEAINDAKDEDEADEKANAIENKKEKAKAKATNAENKEARKQGRAARSKVRDARALARGDINTRDFVNFYNFMKIMDNSYYTQLELCAVNFLRNRLIYRQFTGANAEIVLDFDEKLV